MSNHIGDANKMVSDTPRTDARVRRMIAKDQSPDGLEYWARELERELNAANERIKELEEINEYLRQKNDKLEYGRTNR